MKIAAIFRRLIVVATGSRIGPVTSVILKQRVPMKVLWTAPNVRGTFGDKLVDLILGAAPDTIIYGGHGFNGNLLFMLKLLSFWVRHSDSWEARHGETRL